MSRGKESIRLELRVECHAGYKADERPLRFRLIDSRGASRTEGTRTYEVREVLDQWYGVGYQCFRVRANDNNLYILRHDTQEDVWTLDAFRREG